MILHNRTADHDDFDPDWISGDEGESDDEHDAMNGFEEPDEVGDRLRNFVVHYCVNHNESIRMYKK